jgi:DNA-binding NarL/FixJ family response regulator
MDMEQETTTALALTHSRQGIAQRRQQVGLLLRAGLNQREIAAELHGAVGTVHDG